MASVMMKMGAVVVMVLATLCVAAGRVAAIKIGVSLPLSTPNQADALWVKEIWDTLTYRLYTIQQTNTSLHPEVAGLELVLKDTGEGTRTAAIRAGTEMLNEGVVGIIGGVYSDMTSVLAAQTNPYGIPICDGSSTTSELSDKSQFPTFFRAVPADTRQARVMVDFLAQQGWTQFATVAGQDDYGQAMARLVRELAEERGIKQVTMQSFLRGDGDWKSIVANLLESQATIFLYFGQPDDLRLLLTEGRTHGIVGKGYAWISSETMHSFESANYTKEEIDNLNGMINVAPTQGTGPLFDSYLPEWRLANGLPSNDTSHFIPDLFILFFNDCLEMFVRGYDRILKSLSPNSREYALLTSTSSRGNGSIGIGGPKNLTGVVCPSGPGGSGMCGSVFNFSVETPTGVLTLDRNGDRLGGYNIYYLNVSAPRPANTSIDLTYQRFATWDITGMHVEKQTILYTGGTTEKPPDSVIALLTPPTISYPSPAFFLIILGSSVSILLILASAIAIIIFRNHPIVKASSPSFCLLILVGLMIAAVYPPVVILETPDRVKCVLEIWMVPGAFAIVMGNLLSKIYRVFAIFRDPLRFQSGAIQDKDVFRWGAGILSIELLISMIWTIVSPPRPENVVSRGANGAFQLDTYCISPGESTFMGTAFTYNAVLLVLGTLLAIGTRNLPYRFRESISLSICIYNFFGIALFLLPTAYLASFDLTSRAIIKSVGTYVAIIGTLAPLFFFKFYVIWRGMRRERREKAGYVGGSVKVKVKDVGMIRSNVGDMGEGVGLPNGSVDSSTGSGRSGLTLGSVATYIGSVWVVERRMFLNYWSEKRLIILGDKRIALLVNGKDLSA
ncbi:hypothetical protein HK102_004030, partial [Quaeritorhiza haematococci]